MQCERKEKKPLSLRQTHSSGWVGSPPPSEVLPVPTCCRAAIRAYSRPLLTSCSCVPRSTSTPRSTTRICAASRTVASLCATTSVQHCPSPSRARKARCTSSSDAASSAAVACRKKVLPEVVLTGS